MSLDLLTHAARMNQSSSCIFLTIHILVRNLKKTNTVAIASSAAVTPRVAGPRVGICAMVIVVDSELLRSSK